MEKCTSRPGWMHIKAVQPLPPAMDMLLANHKDSLEMALPDVCPLRPGTVVVPFADIVACHDFPPRCLSPHDSPVISPDGSLVAVQSEHDNKYVLARISTLPTPKLDCQICTAPDCTTNYDPQNMQISALRFSPCSRVLAITCHYDCTLEVATQLHLVDETAATIAQSEAFVWGPDWDDQNGFQWSPKVRIFPCPRMQVSTLSCLSMLCPMQTGIHHLRSAAMQLACLGGRCTWISTACDTASTCTYSYSCYCTRSRTMHCSVHNSTR